jgi:hypothetical protein
MYALPTCTALSFLSRVNQLLLLNPTPTMDSTHKSKSHRICERLNSILSLSSTLWFYDDMYYSPHIYFMFINQCSTRLIMWHYVHDLFLNEITNGISCTCLQQSIHSSSSVLSAFTIYDSVKRDPFVLSKHDKPCALVTTSWTDRLTDYHTVIVDQLFRLLKLF